LLGSPETDAMEKGYNDAEIDFFAGELNEFSI
jgi:hypothetical protein